MSQQFAGQQYELNVVHTLRKSLVFGDATVLTTFSMGWVPDQAAIVDSGVSILTVFNAGTNNLLDIGYRNGGNSESDDLDEYATKVVLTTAGIVAADELATAAVNIFPKGAEITCSLDLTGTAATTGRAVVWVQYIVDNDGDTVT
jgi:hypothetical protein